MQKIVLTLLCCFGLTCSFGQAPRKISAYLQAQFNKTLYDYTKGNNPWGIGAGVTSFLNTPTMFKPLIEITSDVYLEDDKVLRSNPDGNFEPDNSVRGMVNVFAGIMFETGNTVNISLAAGPSFIGGQNYWGLKPSFGFYLSQNKKWMGNVAYINVFDRVAENFGSISFAVKTKLF